MSSPSNSSQRSNSTLSRLRQDNNDEIRARLIEMVGPCPKAPRNTRTHMCVSVVEGQIGEIGPNFGCWQLLKISDRGGFYYVNMTEPLSTEDIARDERLQALLRIRRALRVHSSPNSSPHTQRRSTRTSPRRRSAAASTEKRKLDSDPASPTTEGSPRKARRVEVVINTPTTGNDQAVDTNNEANLPSTARPGAVRVGNGTLFGTGGIVGRTCSATRARLANDGNPPVSPTPVHTAPVGAVTTPGPVQPSGEPLFATAATAHPGPVRIVMEITPDTHDAAGATPDPRNPEAHVLMDATTTTTPPASMSADPEDPTSFIALHRTTVRQLSSQVEAYASVVEGSVPAHEANLRPPGWAQRRIRDYLRRALKQYLDTRRYVILTSLNDISNGGRGYLCPFRSNGFFALVDAHELLAREYGVRRQSHIVYLVSHNTETVVTFDTLLDVQQGDLLIFRFERLPASLPIPVSSDTE